MNERMLINRWRASSSAETEAAVAVLAGDPM